MAAGLGRGVGLVEMHDNDTGGLVHQSDVGFVQDKLGSVVQVSDSPE